MDFDFTTNTILVGNVATSINVSGIWALGLPSGATADRPPAPTNGMIRYNSETGEIESYTGAAWKNIQTANLSGNSFVISNGSADLTSVSATNGQVLIGNTSGAPAAATLTAGTGITITNGANAITVTNSAKRIQQIVSGVFTVATGTTTVPYDGTAPAIGEGTQVWTQSFTPSSATSVVMINISTTIGYASGDAAVILSLFRGSTNIGTVCLSMQAAGLTGATANGASPASFSLIDSPASASAQTYSLRIGSSTGTWYFGRTDLQTLGNATAGNYILKEITA